MKSLTASAPILSNLSLCLCAVLLACGVVGCALSGAWMCAVLLVEGSIHSFLLLGGCEVEVDAELIRYSTGLRNRELKWSEVTRFEITSSAIVFYGQKQRLALPTTGFWKSEAAAPIADYVRTQIQAWGIPQQPSKFAARNTPRPPLAQ